MINAIYFNAGRQDDFQTLRYIYSCCKNWRQNEQLRNNKFGINTINGPEIKLLVCIITGGNCYF